MRAVVVWCCRRSDTVNLRFDFGRSLGGFNESMEDALMAISLMTFRIRGLEALPVCVEMDVGAGMPVFSIVGMAGTSVQEAKDRVRSAVTASGFKFPLTRKIVNLAPAEASKSGSHFDLPMALGLLLASGQVSGAFLGKRVLVLGELGLDGSVREVRGVLSALLMAKAEGMEAVILPHGNKIEAGLVEGLRVFGVRSLKEAVAIFKGEELDESSDTEVEDLAERTVDSTGFCMDFADISGHGAAKRALLVAAAGGHHILMSGPPGSGKSLLAEAFPSLLPPLDPEERLEVLRIHGLVSVGGLARWKEGTARPFRSVHSRSTPTMILGGGMGLNPGEVSLAHRGVLYMDEFPEFDRSVLEGLRGPLEGQPLHLRAGKESAVFP